MLLRRPGRGLDEVEAGGLHQCRRYSPSWAIFGLDSCSRVDGAKATNAVGGDVDVAPLAWDIGLRWCEVGSFLGGALLSLVLCFGGRAPAQLLL